MGASRLFNAENEYLNFTCTLGGSKDCVYSRDDYSDQDNTHDFAYAITSSKSKQQLTAGDYMANITYTATAYSVWGDGEETTNTNGQTVYAFDYTGAYQKFTAPKAGKYRVELWGASGGITTAGNGYFSGKGSNGSNSSGGSSYISGHNGCVAITADSTENDIKQRTDSNGQTCTDGTTDITCSYHYSGYKFTNTVMIDGAGYNWTTAKGDYVGQPQPDGTVTAGHNGNGYVRITYLSAD